MKNFPQRMLDSKDMGIYWLVLLAPLAGAYVMAVRPSCVRPSTFFLVSTMETTFLNQSGPNLHEVFMGTRSRMSSIVCEIRLVTRVIGPERLKIAVFNLVSKIETRFSQLVCTKAAQSIYRHMTSDEFDNERNPPSNSEVNCPGIIENCCFEPC